MKKIKVILDSGKPVVLFLGSTNLAVYHDDKNVRICDGVHNNGGWKLADSYTLEEVVRLIEKA
jgi:hypothetical protein